VERLVDLQYDRNDVDPAPGSFRIRGNEVVIVPPTGTETIIVRIVQDHITELAERGAGLDDPERPITKTTVFPGRFWVSPEDQIEPALVAIEAELEARLKELTDAGRVLEADRLRQRTRADIALMRETGMCHGIENYSRHLDQRPVGSAPFTLVDYFNYVYEEGAWLLIVDESHQTLPQVRGMVRGDNARKDVLIEHGFRLPSAKDNRPLTFEEFHDRIGPTIFQSATPANYELELSQIAPADGGKPRPGVVEQLIRPTGLLDPTIEVRKTDGQLPYLVEQISARIKAKQRVLVTTLTKRLAEELTAWLRDHDISVEYLHSDVKTLERPEILHRLRSGEVDVVVGINLLREGLDLPEVSLVAILDADQEGFLRDETSLVQVMGRAARHTEGHVLLFADRMTKSIRRAIEETTRRRKRQEAYNSEYGITPRGTTRSLERSVLVGQRNLEDPDLQTANPDAVKDLRRAMKKAAEQLDFEKAARLRDLIKKLSK
jgi:excinuclease ABC subunit B